MCVHWCIYLYVYIHVYYVYMCVCFCVYAFVCIYTYMSICVCAPVCACASCVYICVHMHLCLCASLLDEPPAAGVVEPCGNTGMCSCPQIMAGLVTVSCQGESSGASVWQTWGPVSVGGHTPGSLPSHRVDTYTSRLQFCHLTS